MRLDAELVQLDMPGRGRSAGGVSGVKIPSQVARIAHSTGWLPIGVGDGCEPALDPAIEQVVVAALVVRLVRLARDAAISHRKGGMTPPPVAAAVGHVAIQAKIVPARANSRHAAGASGMPCRRSAGAHLRCTQQREAVTSEAALCKGEGLVRHARSPFRRESAAPACAPAWRYGAPAGKMQASIEFALHRPAARRAARIVPLIATAYSPMLSTPLRLKSSMMKSAKAASSRNPRPTSVSNAQTRSVSSPTATLTRDRRDREIARQIGHGRHRGERDDLHRAVAGAQPQGADGEMLDGAGDSRPR